MNPYRHSLCTARIARSRPSRCTTTLMVNSLDPCAIAMYPEHHDVFVTILPFFLPPKNSGAQAL
jgi:hypothetical protein